MLDEELARIERAIVGDIWTSNEQFMNLVKMCDEFGSRFAGTESEKKAVEFMAGRLKAYGLANVASEPFRYTGWFRGRASMEMLEPLRCELPCISLALSPSTPKEGLEAEVINVGAGRMQEYEKIRERLSGKIAMCSTEPFDGEGNWGHRRTRYGLAVLHGAAGFVFMQHLPGQLPQTGSLRPGYRMIGEIPGVGVSLETGSLILRQLKRSKARVRMNVQNEIKPNWTAYNVVGEIPGSKYPDQLILVGAHFDGHDIAQGAADDCAGAVVVMDVARAMAPFKQHFKRTIRFLLFGAEELGVTGSTCYLDQHKGEIEKMTLMINCDGAGRAARHRFAVYGPMELVPYLEAISREINYPMNIPTPLGAASDHWPFFTAGIPAVGFATGPPDPLTGAVAVALGRGFGHTSADTVDKVDPRGLKEASMVLAQFLLRIATEDKPIAKHTPVKEIAKRLEEKGEAEALRIQKKWHPDSVR